MTVVHVPGGPLIGPGQPLTLLGGPCVIEESGFMVDVAGRIAEIARAAGVGYVFKASFDKANRTSSSSFRGRGLDDGLDVLAKVKAELGLPVTTDVHESWQAAPVAAVVDLLQIPALLCRQTDLLEACAHTDRPVNVKKGQFLAPHEARHIVDKLEEAGAAGILLTERGTSFGYNTLVVDFRSLPQLRSFGHPVVFDATHSVQSPGGLSGRSGGRRAYVPYLARAAVAVGVDAVFLEIHPDPDNAPSDGPNMVRLDDLAALLADLVAVRAAVTELPPLEPG